jgi:mannosyltransferase OCH1-like enzyme
MIPKILHFIWLGGIMPEQYVKMVNSWKFHHADWTINIWNDENILQLPLKNSN